MGPKVHVTKWRVVFLKNDNYVKKIRLFSFEFLVGSYLKSQEFVLSPKVHVTKWRVVFLKNDNYSSQNGAFF